MLQKSEGKLHSRNVDGEAGSAHPADSGSAAVHVCRSGVLVGLHQDLIFTQKHQPRFVRTPLLKGQRSAEYFTPMENMLTPDSSLSKPGDIPG